MRHAQFLATAKRSHETMSVQRTSLPPTIARLALLAIAGIIAGCSAAATPGPLATQVSSPVASPPVAASLSATSIPNPTSEASASALSGRWSVVASNARVVLATGDASGGQVTVSGNTYQFTNKDAAGNGFSASGPIEFAGQFDLKCTATYCRIPGTLYEVRTEGGALVIVNSAMLTRYGSTTACGQPPIPGNGVVTVDSLATVQGIQVPAVVRWTGGFSSGTGTDCSINSWQVAWDLVGTRQP